jgi:anti-sigma B factor antagonist
MSALLHIVQRSVSGVVIYELHGRLVLDDGDELLRGRVASLIKDGPLALLVDLRDVSYIDSAGVGVLVEGYLRFMRRGGQLKLLAPSDHVRHVLHITRLDTVLEVFEDESTALRTFDRVSA